MNMQKPIIIITFLLLIMHGFAQDTATQKKFVDVSISLAGLGGDYVTNSMGVQAGVEFRLKNNVSMQCDLRYIFDVDNNKSFFTINVDDLVGFSVNAEVKKYLWQYSNELRGGYIGWKFSLMHTTASIDEYQVKRIKAGLYSIIGWKYIDKSGFLFEATCGIGVQLISSYSTIHISDIYSHSYEFPWSKPYDSGTNLYPDLTLNAKIGWRF